ncbi:MAG: flagellar hook-basal body complex protein [Candidatus Margulisbacteria bacterium]|nr:flagellar hook-basal body complex protein [Candidatus Margulisiibacteriota bacterium]
MLNMMGQAKNAIEAYNSALQASSSNIANMNVTGYKKLDVSFQSVFERVLSYGTAASGDLGGTNPKQTGQGMTLSNVSVDFSAGEFTNGSGLDLAISGQGLFIVSADGGTTNAYSRAGNFEVDSAGNLTSNGLQVYGLDASGNLTAISNLPSGIKSDYQWLADGTLEYSADGGATFTSTGYRIALSFFPNPNGLAQGQGTTFVETPASGSASNAQAPGGAVGSINPGKLEQSNVFYLGETIDALEFQRAMTGNLTVLRMASDMISSFISKLS